MQLKINDVIIYNTAGSYEQSMREDQDEGDVYLRTYEISTYL